MPLYGLGVRTTVTAIGTSWEIRTGANRARVREIGVFLAAATASQLGVGRPAAIGVTPTTPVTLLQLDGADSAPAATSALAWGTAPTAPTAYIRRMSLPATIGTGIIWTFPPGSELVIPASSSIVLYNIAASGVVDAYVVLEE